jgi:hypothetical protein
MSEIYRISLQLDHYQNFKYAAFEYKKTASKGHGRTEVRECWSTPNPEYLKLIRGLENWAGLHTIIMVVCTRIIGSQASKYVRYYISSLLSNAE